MMKKIIALCFLLTLSASAQVELQEPYSYTPPHFYFDALNFKSDPDQSRIDFYLQVPYNQLQFVKSGNEFTASFEVYLQLIDTDGNPVLEQTWDERAVSPDFDETNSGNINSVSQRHFIVKPGSYTLQVSVTDSETKKSFMARRSFTARDYSMQTESISDIMLLKNSADSDGKHTIVPNIDGNVISQKKSFPIFYEVYFPGTKDSIFTTTEIFGAKNKVVYSRSTWLNDTMKTDKIFAEIPKDSIPMGLYKLSVTLRNPTSEGAPIVANATRFFSIHFPELPLTITDLDKAADELMYIAKSSAIDSIKSAPNMFKKEKRFIQFWQRYNSNPSSKRNRSMEEYYNRVAYANQHFTHYFEGWKTDMGMVYILFGPPNSVDRHPFEIDSKPYEVWYYYQRNRRFIFVDDTGFGDYRLITPVWDTESPYGSGYWGR